MRKRTPKRKQKELELCVDICIEDELPDDPEILVLNIDFFNVTSMQNHTLVAKNHWPYYESSFGKNVSQY